MRTITIAPLTRDDRERISHIITAEITRLAGTSACDEESLRRVAHALGCVVENLYRATSPDGAYWPADSAETGDEPTLFVNIRRSPKRRGRILAHELAHDLVTRWVPTVLYDADTVLCFGQDNAVARQDIARRVERMAAE